MVLVVMVPYLGFALYISSRYQPGQWPTWLLYIFPSWFTANFALIGLSAKKIFKGEGVEPERARAAVNTSLHTAIRLTILWCLLFLYGGYGVIRGKSPLNRAIPAGAFLLVFIGIFGWGIYRGKRGKA